MLKWIIGNPWLILGLTLAFLGWSGIVLAKGISIGSQREKTAQALANEQASNTREEIEVKNNRLPKGEAQKKLQERWCLDCS